MVNLLLYTMYSMSYMVINLHVEVHMATSFLTCFPIEGALSGLSPIKNHLTLL